MMCACVVCTCVMSCVVCVHVWYVCMCGMCACVVCVHVWYVCMCGMCACVVCVHVWCVCMCGMCACVVCVHVWYVCMCDVPMCPLPLQLATASHSLSEWRKEVTQLHKQFPQLLFFSAAKLVHLSQMLALSDTNVGRLAQEVSYLFQPKARSSKSVEEDDLVHNDWMKELVEQVKVTRIYQGNYGSLVLR